MAVTVAYLGENLIETAGGSALSASNEDTDYPLENLIDRNAFPAFKGTTASSGFFIKCDHGSAVSFDMVGLGAHNFAGDTWTFQANATDSWGAPSVSQAIDVDTDNQYAFYRWSSTQSYRWTRLVVTGTPSAVPQLGEWWLGASVALTRPDIYPEPRGFVYPRAIVAPEGGTIHATKLGPKVFTWAPSWADLSAAEFGEIEAMMVAAHDLGGRLWWVPDTATQESRLVHVLTSDLDVTQKDVNNIDVSGIQMVEVSRGL